MPEENVTKLNFGEEFDTNGEFELIDEGKYEVVIEKVEPKLSKNQKKYLNITFKIRDDVDQDFKKRKLFYRINEKENDPTGYDFNRLNKIIITQKNTKNYQKYFTDTDEVLQYLLGLHLVITVEIAFDDYSQKDRNQVKDWAFEPSVWDLTDHPKPAQTDTSKVVQSEEPVKKNTEPLDLPDSDLPF